MSDGLPALSAGVDITRLPLTAEDAMVVTRIDGRTRVEELAKLIGKKPADVERIVQKLVGLGAVVMKAPPPQRSSLGAPPARTPPPEFGSPLPSSASKFGSIKRPEPSPTPTKPPEGPKIPVGDGPHEYGAYVFAPTYFAEPGDLEVDVRKKVVFTDEHMGGWTHYQLLGIDPKADAHAIKQAYFSRSKEWHPDRFRRYKQLGTFAKRIEGIYKRMHLAYKVLCDDEMRVEYDATIPKPVLYDVEDILREQIQAERDTRREEEARDRRLKKNPILARFAKAAHFHAEALELEKAGKISEAMRSAQMATTYDDRKPEVRALYERLRDLAGDERIVPYMRRGKHHETMAEWDEALSFFEEAVRIAPNNPEARLRYAYTILHAGRPVDEVQPHAQRALQLAPSEAESHYVMARCYEERGNEKGAKRHFEKALELRPAFAEAQKRLKRLKWGF